jgi:hypothetical protein
MRVSFASALVVVTLVTMLASTAAVSPFGIPTGNSGLARNFLNPSTTNSLLSAQNAQTTANAHQGTARGLLARTRQTLSGAAAYPKAAATRMAGWASRDERSRLAGVAGMNAAKGHMNQGLGRTQAANQNFAAATRAKSQGLRYRFAQIIPTLTAGSDAELADTDADADADVEDLQ